MKTSDFKDLTVWQKSVDLVLLVYDIIRKLPVEEKFCLSDQMRRCSVSIPSNIAEGHGRNSNSDFRRFLFIAKGSLSELETQIFIARKLCYINESDFTEMNKEIETISKMIMSLFRYLESNDNKSKKSNN